MKFLSLFFIMSLLLGGVSCTTNKVEDAVEEIGDNLDDEDDADFVVDADDEELASDEEGEVQELADSGEEIPAIAEEEVSRSSMSGVDGEYIVQDGDTLMYIAFKVFGNYKKWRSLKRGNEETIRNGMPTGSILRYESENFVWSHRGLPYLIKRGDTLGTISSDKYGTTTKWRNIWNNNKEMIQNPDLIFAGFTLYYIAQRDLASE